MLSILPPPSDRDSLLAASREDGCQKGRRSLERAINVIAKAGVADDPGWRRKAICFELWTMGYPIVVIAREFGLDVAAVDGWKRRGRWQQRIEAAGIERGQADLDSMPVTRMASEIERRILDGDVELASLFVPSFEATVEKLKDWAQDVVEDLTQRYDEHRENADEDNPMQTAFDADLASKILKVAKEGGVAPASGQAAKKSKRLILEVDI